MEYNLPPASSSVRLTSSSSAPRLSASLLGHSDLMRCWCPGVLLPSCHVCCPYPPPLLMRVFTGRFCRRLSVHRSTQWGTFPAVSGTVFLSRGDPCPVLRLITLTYQLNHLECCSFLYSAPVCIVFSPQSR